VNTQTLLAKLMQIGFNFRACVLPYHEMLTFMS